MKIKKEMKSAGGGAYFASVPGNWKALASTRARAHTFRGVEQPERRTAHNNTHTPYDPCQNDGDDGARSGELAGLELSIILLTATTQPPSHPATYGGENQVWHGQTKSGYDSG
jgi:hypothetical protein